MFDRSPFPGMDPWLESSWGDVHLEIISRLAEQIADALPPDLFVTVQERVYVLSADNGGEPNQQWVPDVGLFTFDPVLVRSAPVGGILAVAEPIRVPVEDEPVTEGYIEVRQFKDDRPLVTAVEVLRPDDSASSTPP